MTEPPTQKLAAPSPAPAAPLDEEALPSAAVLGSARVAEPVPQVAFLVSRRTDVYQPIVRVLFEARQASRMALTTAQAADELVRREGVRFHALEHLDVYVAQLHRWRIVERDEQHAVEYASLEEYYRGRVTWDLTDAAVQVSRFLETFTTDGDRPGSLGPERLRHVHGELAALAELLETADPAPGRALQAFTNLGAAVDALRAGVMAFMATLQAARTAGGAVDETLFIAYRNGVVEHLEDFRTARRRYAEPILTLIARLERDDALQPLAALAASAEGAYDFRRSAQEARAARERELQLVWRGVREWFVDGPDGESPWQRLAEELRGAIAWIAQAYRRLTEQAHSRVDAVAEFVALAHLFAEQSSATDCHVVAAAAFGLFGARHLSLVEPELTAGRSWLEIPDDLLADVPLHLRSPDKGAPRGRSAQLPDATAARERAGRERAAQRERSNALLARFAALGPTPLSALPPLDADEFAALREWLAAAIADPAPRGRSAPRTLARRPRARHAHSERRRASYVPALAGRPPRERGLHLRGATRMSTAHYVALAWLLGCTLVMRDERLLRGVARRRGASQRGLTAAVPEAT
jgi:uncharacterized protein (TIGR02677 family)